MAKVFIGGLRLCLLLMLMLLVTPVSYSLFDDWGRGVFWRRRKRITAPETQVADYSPTAT